jgi:hypothetical protein
MYFFCSFLIILSLIQQELSTMSQLFALSGPALLSSLCRKGGSMLCCVLVKIIIIKTNTPKRCPPLPLFDLNRPQEAGMSM